MTCVRASSNVALEWYISFLTKQWCKVLKGDTVSPKKGGPDATASLGFPSIHPSAGNLSS